MYFYTPSQIHHARSAGSFMVGYPGFPQQIDSFILRLSKGSKVIVYLFGSRWQARGSGMRLLLVEDEIFIAEAVGQVLKKSGYTVDLAFNGEDGLNNGLAGIYDIIVLDIMLPKMDGLRVLKQLRENDIATPVILLTARGQTEDKVHGLDCGADDYLAKPFQTDELLARLRALGRRSAQLHKDGVLACGDLMLDPLAHTLRCGNDEVRLPPKESQLLELLMRRKNLVTSKEMLIEKVWGYDTDADENRVEMYISFLRKRIGLLGSHAVIQTIRGAGYILKPRG
jgi:DNA-binding response OmpR family regulator